MDLAANSHSRPINGLPGLVVGITGGAVTIAQVVQRFDLSTWFALVLGSATGVGGIGWQIYCSGHNAALRECERLRKKIEDLEDEHHRDLVASEQERASLFRTNEALQGQLARLKAQFAALTPDPDKDKV